MKDTGWKDAKKVSPDEKGRYLCLYLEEETGLCIAEVTDYYHEGDLILYKTSKIEGTPEERILDTIMNPENELRAEADGWYEESEETVWPVYPDYWMYLPEPPEHLEYWSGLED